jgi:hypothetical protein
MQAAIVARRAGLGDGLGSDKTVMRTPDFFIIGAAKSGTTAIYETLKQHPGFRLPDVKEPGYFGMEDQSPPFLGPRGPLEFNYTSSWADYLRIYESVPSNLLTGDASVVSLYRPRAATNIHTAIPSAKCVAVLRNPVDRAYSHYRAHFGAGLEPMARFEDALAAETARIKAGVLHWFHYRERGFYHRQLARYHAVFPKAQLCILLYDDLRTDPEGFFRQLLNFLGAPSDVCLNIRKHHESVTPRNIPLHRMTAPGSELLRLAKHLAPRRVRHALRVWIKSWNRSRHTPALNPETRRALQETYRDDIDQLQDLIQRDLSSWLAETSPINAGRV